MRNYTDYIYPLSENVTALIVMATEHEYGEHLKKLGIKPLITGVGPVNAASELTYALGVLSHARPPCRPDVIINLGSAGSATLEQGKVYLVVKSNYRDMDASAFGFPKGQTPFSPHPPTIEAAAIIQGFPAATCSTGANVVSDHTATGAEMAEMEYSALNDVAMKFGIPCIGFKGISDGKKPLTGELSEWTELLPLIDKNLAHEITKLKTQLTQGTLKKEELCQMPSHWKKEHSTFSPAKEPVLA